MKAWMINFKHLNKVDKLSKCNKLEIIWNLYYCTGFSFFVIILFHYLERQTVFVCVWWEEVMTAFLLAEERSREKIPTFGWSDSLLSWKLPRSSIKHRTLAPSLTTRRNNNSWSRDPGRQCWSSLHLFSLIIITCCLFDCNLDNPQADRWFVFVWPQKIISLTLG